MSAGYSPSHGLGGLAGSHRFSPPVSCPYGIPLKVKTPPSRNPRTLPYCVLAIVERGVLQFPGSWCVSVLVLSDALAVRASAADRPAVAPCQPLLNFPLPPVRIYERMKSGL